MIPNALLNSCYGGVAYVISQAASCALISRQAGGNLGFVSTLNGNIASENTSGIDFETALMVSMPLTSVFRSTVTFS